MSETKTNATAQTEAPPWLDKERLHLLVEYLPESEWDAAAKFLLFLHEQASDPLVVACMKAPYDDEPVTPEEEAAIAEAEESYARGEFKSLEEIRAKYRDQQ